MAQAIRVPGEIMDAKAIVNPIDDPDTTDGGVGNARFGNLAANRIMVGTAGNTQIVKTDGNTVILYSLTAGVWHQAPPFKNVDNSNTTATSITVGVTFPPG